MTNQVESDEPVPARDALREGRGGEVSQDLARPPARPRGVPVRVVRRSGRGALELAGVLDGRGRGQVGQHPGRCAQRPQRHSDPHIGGR